MAKSNLPAIYGGNPPAKRGGLLKVLFGGEDEGDKELREAVAQLERDKVLVVATLRAQNTIQNANDQAQLALRNQHLKNRAYAAMERENDLAQILEEIDYLDLSPLQKSRLRAKARQLYHVNHNGTDPLAE